jgi:hypothetical protein
VSVVVRYSAEVVTRALAAVSTMTDVVESSLGRGLLTDATHLSGVDEARATAWAGDNSAKVATLAATKAAAHGAEWISEPRMRLVSAGVSLRFSAGAASASRRQVTALRSWAGRYACAVRYSVRSMQVTVVFVVATLFAAPWSGAVAAVLLFFALLSMITITRFPWLDRWLGSK